MSNWISIKEKVPPFDTLVVLKGIDVIENNGQKYDIPRYCLAYNEMYRPHCNMTAVYDGYDFPANVKLPIYCQPSFEPTHWMPLEVDRVRGAI
jgi:hypothetical protein